MNTYTVTSGITVGDNFYLRGKCIPSLCKLGCTFYIKNNIPTSGIVSGLNVFLDTNCQGTLPLYDNTLSQFNSSSLLTGVKYAVTKNCLSGIVIGQVLNF